MPGYVNGIPHATSTDRIDLWPTTSRDLAQWIDGNMLRDDDPRMTNARPPTAHQHPIADVTGLAARLAALEYSSGPRNMISEALLVPSSGDITLFRHGGMVTISLNRCVFDVNSTVSQILNLPYAFRPKVIRYETAVTDGSGNPTAGSFQVDGGGAVYLHRITAGQSVRATLTFPTNNLAPDFPPGDPF